MRRRSLRNPAHVSRGLDGTRWLVLCSPAGFEEFVRDVAAAERDPAVLAEISARHGIEILGPPGTLPSEV